MEEMPSGAGGGTGSLQRQSLAAGALMHPQNMFINCFSKLPANPQFETSVEELITCAKCTWAEAWKVCAPSFKHPKGPWLPHH